VISQQQVEQVANLLRDAATQFVLPHGTLRPEAIEKTPGEVVTRVDYEAEAFLSKALTGKTSQAEATITP
jgi:fructose-1,6-bisphosphatase/inositol monophosphatase family enzyme